ncbi:MAG: ribosome-binding factor A [Candidatus Paceibacterota bacterium]|jgi:ribosome-binding factor A
MSDLRNQKIRSLLERLAAQFLRETIGPGTITTVTQVKLSDSLEGASIFITVFPEKNERAVLDVIKERHHEFMEFLIKNTNIKFLPSIVFKIDRGEKNRQRIEELLLKENKK